MSSIAAYDDEALVSLLKTDDQRYFTEIYNRYWDKLFYVAYTRLKSEEDAENVVQDVFCTLWRKRKDLNIQSLAFYLSAMTRHAVYEMLARQKRRSEVEEKAGKGLSQVVDADREMDNKQLLDTIRKFSKTLPEKCSMVFIHNKLLDQPLADVAKMMNISEKTAEAHLTKALKIIREQMKKVPLVQILLMLKI